jgi:transformation/transcription domain-associated protein
MITQFENLGKKLLDKKLDNKTRFQIITEIREGIEIVQTAEYSRFLQAIIPSFILILSQLETSFVSDSIQQKIRNSILEILHRLPQIDTLKTFVKDLMSVLMVVLENDNDENSVIVLKIITDLHKNYKVFLHLTLRLKWKNLLNLF